MPPQGGRKHPQQELIKIDTTNILFILGGAFVGLEKIIGDRVGQQGRRLRRDLKDAGEARDRRAARPGAARGPAQVRADPRVRRPPARHRARRGADRGRPRPHPHRAEERARQAVPAAVRVRGRRADVHRGRAARRSRSRRSSAAPARAGCAPSWRRCCSTRCTTCRRATTSSGWSSRETSTPCVHPPSSATVAERVVRAADARRATAPDASARRRCRTVRAAMPCCARRDPYARRWSPARLRFATRSASHACARCDPRRLPPTSDRLESSPTPSRMKGTTRMSEMPKAYDPTAVEGAIFTSWMAGGYFGGRIVEGDGPVLHRHPAAQRHRLAAHGPRAQQHDPGRAHPPAAHDRPAHALGRRHRPRGHRHAEQGRAEAREAGPVALRRRPREVHRAVLGVAPRARLDDHQPAQGDGLLLRLRRRALHDGPGLPATRCSASSSSCSTRGSSTAASASSTGARAARRRSPTSRSSTRSVDAHLWHIRYPLKEPVGGRDHVVVATTRPETMLGDTCVAVNPDDERYTRPRRRDRRAAAARPRDPDRRRRVRRPGVRHRRGEGHARARPERLRDRRAPRLREDQHPRRRRARSTEDGGPVRRAGPLRGAQARSSPTSRRRACS